MKQRRLRCAAALLLFLVFAALPCRAASGQERSAFADTGLLTRLDESAEEILMRAHNQDIGAMLSAMIGYRQGIGGFPLRQAAAAMWGVAVARFNLPSVCAFTVLASVDKDDLKEDETGEYIAACDYALRGRYAPLFKQAGLFDAERACAEIAGRERRTPARQAEYDNGLVRLRYMQAETQKIMALAGRLVHSPMPDAITPRLEEPSIFVISGTDDLPVLDGAEAAFPVYAAFAAACYADLPPLSEEHLARYDQSNLDTGALTFTNTFHAFRRLLDRSVDIFFGAHPSQRQMQQTTEKGMELVLTPIAKEAFVFFVNDANPVNGLTTGQIRDIYSGKVRNWKKLGGRDAEVMAFQRPEYSGSQSVMRSFMGETEMEEPLQDRLIGGMGGVVEETSEYRNAPGAIGYSFRYFLTGLGRQPRIKMLAVDGILPTPETILYGEYPHVTNLYAITLKDNPNPYVKPFLLWMQGEQGQYLVEKIGYVRLR